MFIKIPLLVYIIIGGVLGLVSRLFFPRWEGLDRYYMGLGLIGPIVIAAIVVIGIMMIVDTGAYSLEDKMIRLGLLVLSEIVVIIYVIGGLKIGF